MMKRMGTVLLVALLSLSLSCSGNSGSATTGSDTIKVGLLVSFSGTLVCAGNYRKAAAELAAYEINNSGGLFDKKVEIIAEDAESDPEKAVAAAQRLAAAGVKMIIGVDRSDSTLRVAQEVTIPQGIVLMSPSSTAPGISSLPDDDLVWRLVPSDTIQGRIAADYAYTQLNRHTAGIIFIDNAYGQGLATAFKSEFEKQGGTVTASVSYPAVTGNDLAVYDFSAQMADLFANAPETIYLVSYYLDGAKITQSMKPFFTATYAPQVIGVDGNYGEVFKGNADPDVIDGMVGTRPDMDESSINYRTFKTNYNIAFNVAPTLYSETTYDAVYLLAYAMLAANSEDPAIIAQNLPLVASGGEAVNVADYAATKAKILTGADIDYVGASGDVSFDANGDVTAAKYTIWQIIGSEYIETAGASLQGDTVIYQSLLGKPLFGAPPVVDRPRGIRSAGIAFSSYSFCQ